MFVVNSYTLAVVFCFVTMLCWGSWGNTQKLAGKTWRYELFYWDYVIGMVLFSLLIGLTMGSFGSEGRSFLEDLGTGRSQGYRQRHPRRHHLQCIEHPAFGFGVAGRFVRGIPAGCRTGAGIGVIVNYIGAPKGVR